MDKRSDHKEAYKKTTPTIDADDQSQLFYAELLQIELLDIESTDGCCNPSSL